MSSVRLFGAYFSYREALLYCSPFVGAPYSLCHMAREGMPFTRPTLRNEKYLISTLVSSLASAALIISAVALNVIRFQMMSVAGAYFLVGGLSAIVLGLPQETIWQGDR